jgi:16S rRNA (adenine1518-N6/adenine1519-N6)-dimethyltransferase
MSDKHDVKSSFEGIRLKKRYGQHFLRNQTVVENMLRAVSLTSDTSVFEIGCGDGFLTRSILSTAVKRLWVFEIDGDWASFVSHHYPDERLQVFEENFLDVDFRRLESHKPWVLLANLPYQVTFPILHLLQQERLLLSEGVIMVQEEVAQKIIATSGRGYGFISLFFQHYFIWKLLDKVPPQSFLPEPQVYSRLLYFKPRATVVTINNEPEFWRFIKQCFRQPRRTLKNNLVQTSYDVKRISDYFLGLRAQEISMEEFIVLWGILTAH